MQNTSQPEESYCSPWDLKIQEEKFLQASQTKNNISIEHCQSSPPSRPPLPPGGLLPFNKSSSIVFDQEDEIKDDSEPLTFQAALLCFQQLTSSDECQTAYEKPWDTKNSTSHIHRQCESLRTKTKTPIFPPMISYRHRTSSLEDQRIKTTSSFDIQHNQSIFVFNWFHFGMSRRQAEEILQSRSPGSFLVRQSESGNQNDYSLSIRTDRNCVHMRINYSSGVYILGECSRPFSSVPQMIDYFSQTSVPIRGATHMKLTQPIRRSDIVMTQTLPYGECQWLLKTIDHH